jgi:hypothetical protein
MIQALHCKEFIMLVTSQIIVSQNTFAQIVSTKMITKWLYVQHFITAVLVLDQNVFLLSKERYEILFAG